MRQMKNAHEEVTRMHLNLYSDDFSKCDDLKCSLEEEDPRYEALSQQLYKMHEDGSALL